jgi:hypothetical protein
MNLTRFGRAGSNMAAKEKNQKQQHADPFDVHRTWEEVHGDDQGKQKKP